MKKFASVLVLTLLLSSFLLAGVAFAQTGTGTPADDQVTVTVTMTDEEVTLSPDTVTVGQEVTFEFADGDTDMADFCVVVLGEDDDMPLNDNDGDVADDVDGNACMMYTFDEAGTYRIAVFEGVDFTEFEFGDDTDFTTLTVVAATQDATATPAATATTAAATPAASGALTTTAVTTGTATTTADATPASLPATGGEANTWVPVALMLGALALVAGGLMRFAFRSR